VASTLLIECRGILAGVAPATSGVFLRIARHIRRVLRPWRRVPEGLTIRKLRADDLPKLFGPSERALGEQWLALQEDGKMYVAVAEVDGAAVGRSCLLYNHAGDPPNAYSFASAVRAEWRSRGIGTAIIAHNEQVARSQRLYHIFSRTAKHNPRAASWQERMGYSRVGEEHIRWEEVDGRQVESHVWRFERTLRRS
jgi:GNAT superfamily N-acetyltransferase